MPSTSESQCYFVQLQIDSYLDGDLALTQQQEFMSHMKQCEACAREFRFAQTMLDTVMDFQLLDCDEKRIHSFQELRHVDGWLSATCEVLMLHVDMAGPKVAPFPPDIRQKVEAMRAAHAGLPRPERAGRSIGIRRKGG